MPSTDRRAIVPPDLGVWNRMSICGYFLLRWTHGTKHPLRCSTIYDVIPHPFFFPLTVRAGIRFQRPVRSYFGCVVVNGLITWDGFQLVLGGSSRHPCP